MGKYLKIYFFHCFSLCAIFAGLQFFYSASHIQKYFLLDNPYLQEWLLWKHVVVIAENYQELSINDSHSHDCRRCKHSNGTLVIETTE